MCLPDIGWAQDQESPGPLWQAQLDPYAPCFTRPGFRDFAIRATGLALNVEEHTITQSLVALDRPQDWKALEAFAEHGAWDEPRVRDRSLAVVSPYRRKESITREAASDDAGGLPARASWRPPHGGPARGLRARPRRRTARAGPSSSRPARRRRSPRHRVAARDQQPPCKRSK